MLRLFYGWADRGAAGGGVGGGVGGAPEVLTESVTGERGVWAQVGGVGGLRWAERWAVGGEVGGAGCDGWDWALSQVGKGRAKARTWLDGWVLQREVSPRGNVRAWWWVRQVSAGWGGWCVGEQEWAAPRTVRPVRVGSSQVESGQESWDGSCARVMGVRWIRVRYWWCHLGDMSEHGHG